MSNIMNKKINTFFLRTSDKKNSVTTGCDYFLQIEALSQRSH